MSILKVIIVSLLVIIEIIYGHDVNLHLNLSNIDENSGLTIGTYKSNFTGKMFPLNQKLDWEFEFKSVVGSSLSKNRTFISKNIAVIKIGDKAWEKDLNIIQQFKTVCKTIRYAYEMNIDDILNESFECQRPVTGYVSRFYCTKNYSRFIGYRCVELHFVALRYVQLFIDYSRFIGYRCVELHFVALRYVQLFIDYSRFIGYRCVELHFVALRYVQLFINYSRFIGYRCVELHFVALRYVQLFIDYSRFIGYSMLQTQQLLPNAENFIADFDL
ncbi:unnamed protein product [Chironomus riparius]|uniref:Uncharacterized protein n=1 Tax=Chironomus riparius TaxID=315576 RepID=A0A9N9WUF2_9DIPT|nr:unnamed protein product [Chironomus riparius]